MFSGFVDAVIHGVHLVMLLGDGNRHFVPYCVSGLRHIIHLYLEVVDPKLIYRMAFVKFDSAVQESGCRLLYALGDKLHESFRSLMHTKRSVGHLLVWRQSPKIQLS